MQGVNWLRGLLVILAILATGCSDPLRQDTELPPAVACGASRPEIPRNNSSLSRPPKLVRSTDYRAIIRTSCGPIKVDLLENLAPKAVSNFVHLAENNFFDGTTWAQVLPNFIIRAGDPNGQIGVPPEGPGYAIRVRRDDRVTSLRYGTIAFVDMGNSTIGSQFFIAVHDFTGALQGRGKGIEVDASGPVFALVSPGTLNIPELIARLRTKKATGLRASVEPSPPAYIESVRIVRR